MTVKEYKVPLIINNKDVQGSRSSHVFPVLSPDTGKELWSSSGASVEDAQAAADAAWAAFPGWSATKPPTRSAILHRVADVLERRGTELAQIVSEETGAPLSFARDFQVPLTASYLRDCAGRINAALEGSVPICQDDNQSAILIKQPYGVVLGIVPWNGPIILGARAVIYPLAAGNTIIMKGSELCPRTFWTIGDIFREAGLPDGCLNVIYHRPEDAAAVTNSLIEHQAVRKINFTGSTATGAIISGVAGRNLKPVLMELGGKASAVVLDDADLDLASIECAQGAYLHAGQICMATERILVQSAILPQFRTKLAEAIDKCFPRDGPPSILVNAGGASKTKNLVADAVKRGAKVTNGELDTTEVASARMQPIVLEGVTKDMDLFYTESFGPQVFLVEVQNDDEAVEIANDTQYGLSAAVFTKDLARGLRMAKRIESGAVHINSMTVHDEPSLPHGGWKKSGFGRFGSSWGIDEFLQVKTITYVE